MADVNSLVAFGVAPKVAQAIVDDATAAELIAYGVAPALATAIAADESDAERLMALGMPANAAVDTVAIITA